MLTTPLQVFPVALKFQNLEMFQSRLESGLKQIPHKLGWSASKAQQWAGIALSTLCYPSGSVNIILLF